jgi:hypothetical protein
LIFLLCRVFIIVAGTKHILLKDFFSVAPLALETGGITGGRDPRDTLKHQIMSTLYIKVWFFFHCLKKQIQSWFLRLGCHFISSWYYIESDSICTRGKVLKINSLFTYQENGFVDIVRVTNVHIERGYVYCSLFFTSKNELITVRHIMQKSTYVLWRLTDKEEYDELMSRKLWYEVTRDEELLEFDF